MRFSPGDYADSRGAALRATTEADARRFQGWRRWIRYAALAVPRCPGDNAVHRFSGAFDEYKKGKTVA